jgi:NitT/TauT family transport system substrate-binding protein
MIRLSLIASLWVLLFNSLAQSADRVRIAYSSISAAYTGIWVARDAGFFAKEGLEDQIIFIPSATQLAQVLVAGDVDIASLGGGPVMAASLSGADLKVIGNNVNKLIFSIHAKPEVKSLEDLRGKRIADTPMEGRDGGFHHGRGNHMMYLIRNGIGIDEVKWEEHEDSEAQFEALKAGKADARFISGTGERYKEAGFHVLPLGPLPMINGPTLTTSYTVLAKKKGLGERLVKALVLGIHFTKSQRAKTERILDRLNKRTGESYSYRSLERMPRKPYPDPQGVINAYELGCIKAPEAKQVNPLALWDLHYLRELDNSGFIDKLYRN